MANYSCNKFTPIRPKATPQFIGYRLTDGQTDERVGTNSSTNTQVRSAKTDNGHMNSAIKFVLTT